MSSPSVVWDETPAEIKFCAITGWSRKRHKVYGTIILQPYVIESCGFNRNFQKEVVTMQKASVLIQQLLLASKLFENNINHNIFKTNSGQKQGSCKAIVQSQ